MTTRSCYYCYCCIDNVVVIVMIIVIVVLLLAQNILSKGTLGPNFNTGAKCPSQFIIIVIVVLL